MKRTPPLLSLVFFEASARLLSFKAAADELCVTPSAVSHRIKALEDHLGLRLFHRFNRRLVLTDAGAAYASSLRTALAGIDRATRNLLARGVAEALTVQMPPSLAAKWLLPRLPRFIERHRDIDVRINATEERVSFKRGGVDLAICHVVPPDHEGHAEVLLTEHFRPLCAPRYQIVDIGELAQLPLIYTERNPVTWAMWLEKNGETSIAPGRGLRIDPSSMAIQAAVEGVGVVLESDILAQHEISAGLLVCPFRPRCVRDLVRHYHLVVPDERVQLPKVRAFSAWLREEAGTTGDPARTEPPGHSL